MSKYPSQEMDRFNVRLPSGMREAIAKRAENNGRSMNSEIVQILSDALEEAAPVQKMNLKEMKELIAANKKLIKFLESGASRRKKPE
jgi:hypothetical protein